MGKWISILFVVVVLVTNIVGAIAQHQAKRRAEERKARELMQRRGGAVPGSQPVPTPAGRQTGGYGPPGLQTRVSSGAGGSGSGPKVAPSLPADVLADRRQQRLAELQRKQDVAAARRMADVERASQSTQREAERTLEARIAREHKASELPPHERLGRLQRTTQRGAIGSRRVGSAERTKRKKERREPAPRGTRGRVTGGGLQTPAGTSLGVAGVRQREPHWLQQRFGTPRAWRDGIILREVLGPPRGMESLEKIGM